jgi:cation diffusion facilitator family transporter
VSTEGGAKAVVAALFANLGIAVAKFVAFALTGSASMLAEAVHSCADSGNQLLLIVGGRRARRAPDEHHPFGYGRVRYVYAFVVSIVLFLVGGIFSLYEGFHKWQHPEELSDARIAVIVLVVAIGLESWSFRTAFREANRSRGRHSLFHYIRRARQPELPVVLLEDTGALIGLLFALIGVTMAVATGNGRWDALGAMAVGSLLVVIAVFLSFEMSSLLVGEAALPEEERAVRSSTCAPSTPAPTSCWSVRRSRSVPRSPVPTSPPPSTSPSSTSARRCQARAGSTSSPISTGRRSTVEPSGARPVTLAASLQPSVENPCLLPRPDPCSPRAPTSSSPTSRWLRPDGSRSGWPSTRCPASWRSVSSTARRSRSPVPASPDPCT